MKFDEFNNLIQKIKRNPRNGLLWALFLVVIFLVMTIFRPFLQTYFAKKGEQLAITRDNSLLEEDTSKSILSANDYPELSKSRGAVKRQISKTARSVTDMKIPSEMPQGRNPMESEKVYPITVKSAENINGPPKPNELQSILLKNGKKPPKNMQVKIMAPHIPNHAHLFVKLPDEDKFEDLGDLPIIEGTVFLPVPFVFLSYASEDEATVSKLNMDLKQHGILTWLDKQNLLPGDNWQSKIEQAIESSDYVLVFLSEKSIQKRGTFQREIKYALDQMLERPSNE